MKGFSHVCHYLCDIELICKLSESQFFFFKMDLLLKLSILG